MKVRLTDKPEVTGQSHKFNMSAIAEVLVGFDNDGGYDTCYIKDLDVFIEAKQEWMTLRCAFHDNDVIVDNYNTTFFEPRTKEDRERGFTFA